MRGYAVLDRNDRIAVSPDEHERDVLGQIQPVAGVDSLAPGLHDRAERVHERGPGVRVGQRGVTTSQLRYVGAGLQPDPPERASDCAAGLEQPSVSQQRKHDLGQR